MAYGMLRDNYWFGVKVFVTFLSWRYKSIINNAPRRHLSIGSKKIQHLCIQLLVWSHELWWHWDFFVPKVYLGISNYHQITDEEYRTGLQFLYFMLWNWYLSSKKRAFRCCNIILEPEMGWRIRLFTHCCSWCCIHLLFVSSKPQPWKQHEQRHHCISCIDTLTDIVLPLFLCLLYQMHMLSKLLWSSQYL